MKTKLVVMLTQHDKTVPNALEEFESAKDLNVECWGFKDVGLPQDKMKTLLNAMKAAGKQTFLEVVSYSEEECMAGAKLAVELGFDGLMGTIFYPAVWAFLKDQKISYFPFVGNVHGSPSVLEGTIEEIVAQGKALEALGVAGIDILAYRHKDNPEKLAEAFVKAMDIPVVIAGSINDRARMQFVEDIGAYGFTMGSALFQKDFVKDGSFRDNLDAVVKLMADIHAK